MKLSTRSCSESVISGIWVFMNWYADEYIVSKASMRCVDNSSSLCISDCNTNTLSFFRVCGMEEEVFFRTKGRWKRDIRAWQHVAEI